jgi:hypothetical protein
MGDQKGCSVRIGCGNDHSEPLTPDACCVYEFVEHPDEVKKVISIIKCLPTCYAYKKEALIILEAYLENHAWKKCEREKK